MLEFAWLFAFLLLPLPVLVYFVLPKAESQQPVALRVPNLAAFDVLQPTLSNNRLFSWSRLLIIIIWLLLVTALARPQWVGEVIKLPVSGRDLLLAVDLSGSMETKDMRLNNRFYDRLTALKQVVIPFIDARKGDRLGLILFGDHAYLQTPLTYDSKTVQTMLAEAVLGLAGQKTAIGEAIGLAVKKIKDLPAEQSQSRVLILLTDGANTAGIAPLKVAKLAAQLQLKIYTIGFGADEMIVSDFFGQRKVNPSRDLDENTLKQIAQVTGGQYFRARDTAELQKIYTTLNQLEAIESDDKTYRPVKDLFFYPLSVAFLLACGLLVWRRQVL